MPYGKLLVAIANQHTRQRRAMLAHEEAYDAGACLPHPMALRSASQHAVPLAAIA